MTDLPSWSVRWGGPPMEGKMLVCLVTVPSRISGFQNRDRNFEWVAGQVEDRVSGRGEGSVHHWLCSIVNYLLYLPCMCWDRSRRGHKTQAGGPVFTYGRNRIHAIHRRRLVVKFLNGLVLLLQRVQHWGKTVNEVELLLDAPYKYFTFLTVVVMYGYAFLAAYLSSATVTPVLGSPGS